MYLLLLSFFKINLLYWC